MIVALRREMYRWLVIGVAALRIAKARRLSARVKRLQLDAAWERQEAQLMLDAMPPTLLRRAGSGERR